MRSHPRIISAVLLVLILPTLCQPLGARIIVRCSDGTECPDINREALSTEQLERCELVCDAIEVSETLEAIDAVTKCTAQPVCDTPCADTCESPCDVPTIEIEFPFCIQRCVFTTVPARDLSHDFVRNVPTTLAPLPIADRLLAAVIEHRSIEFSRAVEHVPIVLHRIELAPAEGIGPRSPPRNVQAV